MQQNCRKSIVHVSVWIGIFIVAGNLGCGSSGAQRAGTGGNVNATSQPEGGGQSGAAANGRAGAGIITGGSGIAANGGATSTGGVAVTGGATSSGGVAAIGGLASATGGATSSRGGATTTGGRNSVGGATSTGGATTTGGRNSVGGATSTGGATTTGGKSGAGGAASAGGTTDASTTPQVPTTPLATVETDSFTLGSVVDVADDSAIYANPTSPELSVVVADNKDETIGGLGVFDMKGKLLQFRQDGMIGNVDLRSGFSFGGSQIVLVGANNRTNNTIQFWQLLPAARQLSAPIGETATTITTNYGFCLYHSGTSGKFYAFVTQYTSPSTLEQYELGESAGKVTATLVRSFDVGTITEGCVADDELGRLYVAQEDVALWRYGAEPSTGSTRVQVGAVGDAHLAADLEGVALAKGPKTSGYIVVSVQSESRFVIYDRETNAYLKGFSIGANGAIDVVSETDGLDISTANLGPGFPKGALVVHDGSNTGGVTSNLKYIPLE
jgi:3-phytase